MDTSQIEAFKLTILEAALLKEIQKRDRLKAKLADCNLHLSELQKAVLPPNPNPVMPKALKPKK